MEQKLDSQLYPLRPLGESVRGVSRRCKIPACIAMETLFMANASDAAPAIATSVRTAPYTGVAHFSVTIAITMSKIKQGCSAFYSTPSLLCCALVLLSSMFFLRGQYSCGREAFALGHQSILIDGISTPSGSEYPHHQPVFAASRSDLDLFYSHLWFGWGCWSYSSQSSHHMHYDYGSEPL